MMRPQYRAATGTTGKDTESQDRKAHAHARADLALVFGEAHEAYGREGDEDAGEEAVEEGDDDDAGEGVHANHGVGEAAADDGAGGEDWGKRHVSYWGGGERGGEGRGDTYC